MKKNEAHEPSKEATKDTKNKEQKSRKRHWVDETRFRLLETTDNTGDPAKFVQTIVKSGILSFSKEEFADLLPPEHLDGVWGIISSKFGISEDCEAFEVQQARKKKKHEWDGKPVRLLVTAEIPADERSCIRAVSTDKSGKKESVNNEA